MRKEGTMKRKWVKRSLLALLPLIFALGIFGTVRADENPPKQRTIQVTGEGKVTAVPDQAELDFEVQEEGSNLEEVTAKVNEKMGAIFEAVKSFGISDKDFKTIQYDIQPKYKYDNGESQRVGFTVSNRIQVVLKKIDQAGKLMDAVTEAGATQVQGPSFGFSDPAQLQIEALKKAVEDAHAKAEALAEASGAELGKVFSITQTGSALPVRPMAFRANGAMGSAEVPIAKGENDVTAEVEVVYFLR